MKYHAPFLFPPHELPTVSLRSLSIPSSVVICIVFVTMPWTCPKAWRQKCEVISVVMSVTNRQLPQYAIRVASWTLVKLKTVGMISLSQPMHCGTLCIQFQNGSHNTLCSPLCCCVMAETLWQLKVELHISEETTMAQTVWRKQNYFHFTFNTKSTKRNSPEKQWSLGRPQRAQTALSRWHGDLVDISYTADDILVWMDHGFSAKTSKNPVSTGQLKTSGVHINIR